MADRLIVDIGSQRLSLDSGRGRLSWPVSTAIKGTGEQEGSEKTPRGWHVIRAKIGDGAPLGAVFVGRRPTGEVATRELMAAQPDRDWVLTRILWLSGLEKGRNRLGLCDTMRRYIYIHGVLDGTPMGIPGSKGCIRMRNQDVIDLYDRVRVGTLVLIRE